MLRASSGWFPWNLLGSRMVLLVMAITRRATVALLVAFVSGCTASRGTAPHESQGLGSSASAAAPSPHQGPWAKLEARPFHIPSVDPGAPCPKTTRGLHAQEIHQISSVLRSTGPRIALGSGPVYPFFFFGGAFYRPSKPSGEGSAIRPANQPGAWDSIKTLWIAPRSFEGRVLVRGRQINGLHPAQVRCRESLGSALSSVVTGRCRRAAGREQPLDRWDVGECTRVLRVAAGLLTRLQDHRHRDRSHSKRLTLQGR